MTRPGELLKPVKKRKKSKTPMKTCDELFSKIVRSRGACEHCSTALSLQCAHGFSRRYRAVRWDERNAFCLCAGCHLFFTMRPLEWEDWLRQRWGDRQYDLLRFIALSAPNPSLKDTAARLRERARELGVAA